MAQVHVRRRSSGEIIAVRFKREKPEMFAVEEFESEIAPCLRNDPEGNRFIYRRLTMDEVDGWCTLKLKWGQG